MEEYIKENFDFEYDCKAASIGAQGPDIFFFHRALPVIMPGLSLRKIGSALHRAEPGKIFDAFAEYWKKTGDSGKSYITGFILHYSLDRQCHPYVYAMQNEILKGNRFLHKGSAHNIIEMSADSYFLSDKGNYRKPSDFFGADTVKADGNTQNEIAQVIKFTVAEVLGNDISLNAVRRALDDTVLCQKILRDPTGILTGICRITETILGPITHFFKFSSMIKPKDLEKAKKCVNIDRVEWCSPYCNEKRCESFDDLFKGAKSDAVNLLAGFKQIISGRATGEQITNNISFLTGVKVK